MLFSTTFNELRGDFKAIVLLMILYILQGIPIGVSNTITILLQRQHVSYSQQALFAICSQPYSLKMLWAPVVDALYSKKMGRRKTWVVPLQLTIGLMFILFSSVIEKTLYSTSPNVPFLTICFTIFYFLAATQDIAVDGWALTLLSNKNKGWASTCNVVGQTLGIHIANTIFLALNDPKFLSDWRGEERPMVTLRSFSIFWGIFFIIFTLYVYFFIDEEATTNPDNQTPKKEEKQELVKEKEPLLTNHHSPHADSPQDDLDGIQDESELSVFQTYRLYYDILKNPYFLRLALILLTNRIGVFPSEAAATLQLIDKGMKSLSLTSLQLFYFPFDMIVTIVISRVLSRMHPLTLMYYGYIWRITMSMLLGVFIHYLPESGLDEMESKYYPLAYLLIIVSSIARQTMNVAAMSYYAQISDPRFGGSYMSLFNTLSNFGHNVYVSPFLKMIDLASKKECVKDNSVIMESCVSKEAFSVCLTQQGQCVTRQDGFYMLVWPSFIYGITWAVLMQNQFRKLKVVNIVTSHSIECFK